MHALCLLSMSMNATEQTERQLPSIISISTMNRLEKSITT